MSSFQEDKMVLRQLFATSVNSVLPHVRLGQLLKFEAGILSIEGKKRYKIEKPVKIVGFGKAVIGMAAELQRILGQDSIGKMVLSVPYGICDQLKSSGQEIQRPKSQKGFELYEGAKDNIPDENALEAAKEISKTVENLNENDLVIVLVSGGGSALLPAPKPPLSLDLKAETIRKLSNKGATIQEMNMMRIQLSTLKGGKLASKAHPGQVLGFILSDIIGDPLEFISSGPTVLQNNLVPGLDILKKYQIEPNPAILDALQTQENLKINENIENILIGNNKIALEACLNHAKSENLQAFVISNEIIGEAKIVGGIFGTLAYELSQENPNFNSIKELFSQLGVNSDISDKILKSKNLSSGPLCLISGGETTVKVTGPGRGGRNLELVLSTLIKYHELLEKSEKSRKITFLSGGTDGIDGPTDVAGAICDENLVKEALEKGLNPQEYLENNDSYNFFQKLNGGKNFLKTGHTGTNVMDIQLLIPY